MNASPTGEPPTAPTPAAPPEVRHAKAAAGPARRCLRTLFFPIRFAYRRPRRAALFLVLFVLVTGAIAGAGVWIWFAHHLRAARAEVARGHNAAAARHLDRCRLVRPDDREVLLLSARVARRSGGWDTAEATLDHFTTLYGEEQESVLERLLLRAARGELEQVGPALLSRIRAGGAEAELAREAVVTGLVYRFRWGEALRFLDEWLATDPHAIPALLLRGKLEEQRLATAPAIGYYRRIVEADPEHDEARLRLTTLLLTNRHGGEALAHLTELRKRLPNQPEVAVQWAQALALVGRTDESRAALAECLGEHPDYPPALAERGGQALLDGDEAAAERYLARAVDLDPGNVVTRGRYAFALARSGKRGEAAQQEARVAALKADLERITVLISGPLQERPNDPSVHHEIAQIALRSGQIREALRWYTSALQVDPNYLPTHQALAVLYHELGKPGLAGRHRALAQRHG